MNRSEYETRFLGVTRLFGERASETLRRAHVCVVGIGGVGSWAVEALARSGVGTLTLIDLDEVCASNINRQLPALTSVIGQPKVQVMRQRILEINPECTVQAVEAFFTGQNVHALLAGPFDYLLDAIDDVPNKCLLLAECRDRKVPVVTTGAAGGRRDPGAIRVADLALASHDPLLRAVRRELRGEHGFPTAPEVPFGIEAVYSTERPGPPVDQEVSAGECFSAGAGPRRLNCDSGYGTASFVTGSFGFAAAGQVVAGLVERGRKLAK